jgi:diguanylate cyclase (GGDEF)-like protein
VLQGLAGRIFSSGKASWTSDYLNDPTFPHAPTADALAGEEQLRAILGVPLRLGAQVLGVLFAADRTARAFTPDEVALLSSLADHAAIAIANAQLYREVEVASLTDDLTGLGNTRAFHRVLPSLLATRLPLSLLVLDLDHLKMIVDTYGHLVGSRTIATVGRLIAEQLRPGDTAARFGGDEFVVVLPATDTVTAGVIAERIRGAVAICTRPDGYDVDITALTASIGIATAPVHATDPDGLFRAADGAMYAVKRVRRDGVAVVGEEPRARTA